MENEYIEHIENEQYVQKQLKSELLYIITTEEEMCLFKKQNMSTQDVEQLGHS